MYKPFVDWQEFGCNLNGYNDRDNKGRVISKKEVDTKQLGIVTISHIQLRNLLYWNIGQLWYIHVLVVTTHIYSAWISTCYFALAIKQYYRFVIHLSVATNACK